MRDADGRSYIDYVQSYGPHLFGHVPPFVRRAISKAAAQRDVVRRADGARGPARRARRRDGAVDRDGPVRQLRHGGDDERGPSRARRDGTPSRIVKVEGGYHGHADGFLVSAGSGVATLGIAGSPGVPDEIAALTIVVPYNDLGAVEQAFRRVPGEIAAVIVEPLAANMGARPAGARVTSRVCARLTRRSRGAPRVRRGDQRLPPRGRRRAGALRGAAGPDDARQDPRRRAAGRRVRRAAQPHGADGAGGSRVPGGHAVGKSARDVGGDRDALGDRAPPSLRGARAQGRAARGGRARGDSGERMAGSSLLRPRRVALDALLRLGALSDFASVKRSDTAAYGRFFHAMLRAAESSCRPRSSRPGSSRRRTKRTT